MDRKLSIIIAILLVLSLLANIALLFVLTIRGEITGFSTKAMSAGQQPVFEKDIIEINKTELDKCCSFINAQGKEDGCYVLNNYDCGYCSSYCK